MVGRTWALTALVLSGAIQEKPPVLHRVVDLAVGESAEVELAPGKKVTVRLLDLKERRDSVRSCIREARVRIAVGAEETWLSATNYHLPVAFAGVQVDCPITRGWYADTNQDRWGLADGKDARLRLWPAGSPFLPPDTFVYPVRQRWFASDTQMCNEPVFIDGPENPASKKVYYHSGLDLSGQEGRVEILSAVDGTVVASGKERAPEGGELPVPPSADAVILVDGRGWHYWYCHFQKIEIAAGQKVKRGERIGLMGKEGGSGGYSHLHFEIKRRQASGTWGTEDGYAFLWEAYVREYGPPLLAVARPHHLLAPGETATLDGGRSRSFRGEIVRYEWTFTDGSTASGARVERKYDRPGTYSEVLKVVDSMGNAEVDFTEVQVLEKDKPLPPAIHPTYFPTFGLQPGDPVTFTVRSFRTQAGEETWDFGDGTPAVKVKSDGNARMYAPDGYARAEHRFEKPGRYVVRVERPGPTGALAVGHLAVTVGDDPHGRK